MVLQQGKEKVWVRPAPPLQIYMSWQFKVDGEKGACLEQKKRKSDLASTLREEAPPSR